MVTSDLLKEVPRAICHEGGVQSSPLEENQLGFEFQMGFNNLGNLVDNLQPKPTTFTRQSWKSTRCSRHTPTSYRRALPFLGWYDLAELGWDKSK
jgi:hypothetical protein